MALVEIRRFYGPEEAQVAASMLRAAGIDHRVIWWDDPFNYGAVNNRAAAAATESNTRALYFAATLRAASADTS